LVIDELGYLTLKPEQANALFRLMDQRYNRVSTIITTNLDLPDWYDLFDKKSLVDALLDRLQHHCITIRIDGPSLRRPAPAGAEPPAAVSAGPVTSRDQGKPAGDRSRRNPSAFAQRDAGPDLIQSVTRRQPALNDAARRARARWPERPSLTTG